VARGRRLTLAAAAASDALRVAEHVVGKDEEEITRKLEVLNAMNLARPEFVTLEEKRDPDGFTGHPQIDRVLLTLRPVLPKGALDDAMDFVIANFWKGKFTKRDGSALSLEEIVRELPLGVRRQVVSP
jgi:hypothetical protein